MELKWENLMSAAEYDLIVKNDAGAEFCTGWTIRRVAGGYTPRYFSLQYDPFPTLDEAKRYCEVCYRVGVHREI